MLLYAAAEFGPGTRGLLERDDAKFMLQTYIKDGKDATDPRFAVIRAADHKGLPPATVITCEVDPLRDEGMAYAEKLKVCLMPAVAPWGLACSVCSPSCKKGNAKACTGVGRLIGHWRDKTYVVACVHGCVTSIKRHESLLQTS